VLGVLQTLVKALGMSWEQLLALAAEKRHGAPTSNDRSSSNTVVSTVVVSRKLARSAAIRED
jgi:hypothetical protein